MNPGLSVIIQESYISAGVDNPVTGYGSNATAFIQKKTLPESFYKEQNTKYYCCHSIKVCDVHTLNNMLSSYSSI